ncbi:somatotropin [Leptosomus discolor]
MSLPTEVQSLGCGPAAGSWLCQWHVFAQPSAPQSRTPFSTTLPPHLTPRDDRGQTEPQGHRTVWIILASPCLAATERNDDSAPQEQEDARIQIFSQPCPAEDVRNLPELWHLDLQRAGWYPNKHLGSWFSPLLIAVITLGLQWPQEAATFPAMPLSNLFANAVLRAQHLHLLAAETYKEFERTYIPEDQRHANKNSQAAFCYSETIPAPTGKDDAQQKSDMELLRFSLVLIQSWLTPVQYLSKVFTNNLVFGTSDRVYEKLKDLEEGIQALMRELEDRSPRGPQILKPTYDKFDIHLRNEDALLKNYSLLSCFKKDLHKVETYLKVMKCRRYGEGNCTV